MASQMFDILTSGMHFVVGSRKAVLVGAALALCVAALVIPALGTVFIGLAVLLLLTLVAAMGGRVVQERSRVAELEAELTIASSNNTRSGVGPAPSMPIDLEAAKREILDGAEQLSRNVGTNAVVTVVVPCFNDASFLPMALESLQRQLLQDWRCIVVDDGSTDNTSDVTASFASSDDRISGIKHTENRGLSAARNTGLQATTTEFVCFLDADDFLTPASLADRAVTLANTEDALIAGSYCGIVMVSEDATLDSVAPLKSWTNPGIHDFASTEGDCPFNCHAPMLRTSVVTALGGFNETMRSGGEDWDLWLRLMRNGYYFVPSRFFGGVYRQRRSSMVRLRADAHLAASRRLLKSTNEQVDNAHIRSDAPLPMKDPASDYRLRVRDTERTISFAAISATSGNMAWAQSELAALDPRDVHLVRRHRSIHELVRQAVVRGFANVPHNVPSAHEPEISDFVERLLRALPANE